MLRWTEEILVENPRRGQQQNGTRAQDLPTGRRWRAGRRFLSQFPLDPIALLALQPGGFARPVRQKEVGNNAHERTRSSSSGCGKLPG